ncbi:MAG: WD40 repeat domain-containing protein, partial [Spirochaetota bacterium]
SRLYSCSSDKTIRCWDVASGTERYRSVLQREPNSMVLSTDGRTIYCSPVHSSLYVLEAASGREIRTITQKGSIIDIRLSLDNRILACGTYEGWLNLIDTATGTTVRSIKAHSRAIKCVAFSPDQTIVYTGSEDQSIGAWDVAGGSRIHSFGGSPVQIARNACYSADGKHLILSNNEYGSRQWALPTAALSDTPVSTRAKGAMALSRDGSLAAAAADGSIQLWDLTNGRMLKSISAHSSFWPVALDISPDGKRAASGSFKELRLIDTTNGTIKGSFPAKGQVQAVRFSPDGKRFLTAESLSNCVLRDSATGSVVLSLGPENQYLDNAVFSPDGTKVLTKLASTLILWDSKTGNKIAETAINHLFQQDNNYLAFSPDGTMFLAGGETIGLFETATLKQIKTFTGHRNYIYSAVFHPGGKQFVTTSRDGTVRCWDLDSGAWTAFVTGTDPSQWLIFNNEGYWDASARGGDFVAAVKGLDVWNIDQFALRTNRPDLILARFADADPGFIRHLRSQYEKRLRRMNMSESDLSSEFAAPTSAITGLTQKGNSATISASFSSAGKSLQRYQIHINDVPLFGREGKSISGKKASITERIVLTGGENKIEISCMDAGGIESSRALRYATAETA